MNSEGRTPWGRRAVWGLGRLLLGASLLGFATLSGSGALAQDTTGEPPAPPAGSIELAPSPALSEHRDLSLSADDQLGRAKDIVLSIERASQSLQRDLQSARKDRDVVRVLCLNDKLNQVDVALRSAQDRVSAVQAAVERKDAERSRHEYTVLLVLNDSVRVAVNESTQCVGEETGFIGEAEVSVSIDPNLPDSDTGSTLDTYSLPPPPNISSPIE